MLAAVWAEPAAGGTCRRKGGGEGGRERGRPYGVRRLGGVLGGERLLVAGARHRVCSLSFSVCLFFLFLCACFLFLVVYSVLLLLLLVGCESFLVSFSWLPFYCGTCRKPRCLRRGAGLVLFSSFFLGFRFVLGVCARVRVCAPIYSQMAKGSLDRSEYDSSPDCSGRQNSTEEMCQ